MSVNRKVHNYIFFVSLTEKACAFVANNGDSNQRNSKCQKRLSCNRRLDTLHLFPGFFT